MPDSVDETSTTKKSRVTRRIPSLLIINGDVISKHGLIGRTRAFGEFSSSARWPLFWRWQFFDQR
jgi:hypothetical protein